MVKLLTFVFSLQEVFGGNAASDEYHIARHVANLFVVQTYEGQSDIHGKSCKSGCVGQRLMRYSIDSRPCHHRRTGLCLEIEYNIQVVYGLIYLSRDINASPARDIIVGLKIQKYEDYYQIIKHCISRIFSLLTLDL